MSSQTVILSVRMSCEDCSGAVRRVLSKMEGVESFGIDMKQQKVTVKGNVEPEAVLQTVAKTGKKSSFWEEEVAPESKHEAKVVEVEAETKPAVKTEVKTETIVKTEAESETKEETKANDTAEVEAETETKEKTKANAAEVEVEVEIETAAAKIEAKATELEVEGEPTPPVQTEKTKPEEVVVTTA